MKKFDLEKALAGEPVVTRDGLEVNELVYFKTTTEDQSIFGVVNGEVECWSDCGKYNAYATGSGMDLAMRPIAKTYWMNVYKGTLSGDILSGKVVLTEAEAVNFSCGADNYLKTISFTITE